MLPIIEVIHDVEGRVRGLFERTADQYGEIERRHHVMRHAPVVAGTRIPTAAVRRLRDDGYSVAGILEEYPSLTEQDVRARSEEHTSELQSLMRISYAVFCLKQKKNKHHDTRH